MSELQGRRVVVLRASHQAAPLVDGIGAAGGDAVHVPLVEVVSPRDHGAALRAALAGADRSTWVLATSANGVDAVARAVAPAVGEAGAADDELAVRSPSTLEWSLAVVGRATAARAALHHLPVAFESPEPSAAGLGRTLPATAGQRVIAAVAELAGPDLGRELAGRNLDVEIVTAYRTVAPAVSTTDLDRIRAADVVLVTAPSIIDRLLALVEPSDLPALVAIGATTRTAIEAAGLDVAATADRPTVDGLIRAAVRSLGS